MYKSLTNQILADVNELTADYATIGNLTISADSTTALVVQKTDGIPVFTVDCLNGRICLADGSATVPSLYFSGGTTNTGIYCPGTDSIGLTIDGALSAQWSSSGQEIVNSSGRQLRLSHTSASKYADFKMDTNNDLTISTNGISRMVLDSDGDTRVYQNIYLENTKHLTCKDNAGVGYFMVGIDGSNNQIFGNTSYTSYFQGSNTYLEGASNVYLKTGGSNRVSIDSSGYTTFNNGIIMGTGGNSYVPGCLGYTDSYWGFLHRPPRAGTAAAHGFTNYAGNYLMTLDESGYCKVYNSADPLLYLELKHDGSNGSIETSSGSLVIGTYTPENQFLRIGKLSNTVPNYYKGSAHYWYNGGSGTRSMTMTGATFQVHSVSDANKYIELTHNGTDGYFSNNTGITYLTAPTGSAVILKVGSYLTAQSYSGNFRCFSPNDSNIYVWMEHNGANGYISNTTGNLEISTITGGTIYLKTGGANRVSINSNGKMTLTQGGAGSSYGLVIDNPGVGGMQLYFTTGGQPSVIRDNGGGGFNFLRSDASKLMQLDNSGYARVYNVANNAHYIETYHNGTNGYISNTTGSLEITTGTGGTIYFKVGTNLTGYSNAGYLVCYSPADNSKHTRIQHDGTNGYVMTNSGSLYVGTTTSAPVYIRINGADKQYTQTNGDVNFYGASNSNVLIAGYGSADSVLRAVNGPLYLEGTGHATIRATTGNNINFQVNGVNKMIVYSSGYVSMGSATDYSQHVENGTSPFFWVVNTSGVQTAIGSMNSPAEGNVGTTSNSPLNIITNNSAKIKISGAGDIGINMATATNIKLGIDNGSVNNKLGLFIKGFGSGAGWGMTLDSTSNDTNLLEYIQFRNAAGTTVLGTIRRNNGLGGLEFENRSDRRLKTDIVSLDDSKCLGAILSCQPRSFKWTATDTPTVGFIADEIQGMIPDAVTGQPNEVDGNNNPKYQTIHFMPIIANLVGAIKELTRRVAELEKL